MTTIKADTGELKANAKDMLEIYKSEKELVRKLDRMAFSLDIIWKGEAQQAFTGILAGRKTTMDGFLALLKKYAELVNYTAEELEAAEQSARQLFVDIS